MPSNQCYRVLAAVFAVSCMMLRANDASAQARRPACERLLDLVKTAPAAALSSRQLHTCGPDGAAALASFVRRAAIQSDSAYLFELDLATGEASLRAVLDAAIELVQTRTAPLSSRVEALQIAVRQVYGRDAFLAGDFAESANYCRMGRVGAEQLGGGAVELDRLGKNLSDDRSEPVTLRQAGLCIVRSKRRDYALAEDVSQIHVTVRCSSFYFVQNDLDHQVTVRVEEPNGKKHVNLTVGARGGRTAYFADQAGITRFFSADQLIAAVPSSTKPCGGQP